jgi:hypothetical protein
MVDLRSSILVLAALLPVASSAHAAAPSCAGISLSGNLRAGQAFAQEIGGGLELRLIPTRFADPAVDEATPLEGWVIKLLPVGENDQGQDRIFPVNPPLRLNPAQDIGTSHGITAEEKLQRPIVYAFVPGDADYRRIAPLAQGALWPYAAPDPQHAEETYLTGLARIELGAIRFVPTRSVTGEGGRSLREVAFRAEVTAPQGFSFPDRFQAVAAECPARDDWP